MARLAQDVLSNEPGCARFEYIVDTSDPSRRLVIEGYRDETALAVHSASGYLADFLPELLARRLPKPVPASIRPLDRPGILLSILALGSLTFGCIDGGTNGWARPRPILALVLASTTTIPAATAEMSVAAPSAYAASAQGALNAGRQAGSALGVAILGPMTSLQTVGTILALLSVATVAICARRPRGRAESGAGGTPIRWWSPNRGSQQP
jgi:hypothetical protein